MKEKITIGIPCYQNAPAETLEDYMRFMYWCGRRMPDYDFFLAIKPKYEQFRARNAIVTAAMQVDSKYLLMLDDDQVIDWENSNAPSERYDFLSKLIGHMEDDPKLGVVGALYYHRGGSCRPVIMKEGKDGGYTYMRDDEITSSLQDVAIQGGGCMLLNTNMLTRIGMPIFEPEFKYGTDIQVCQKARDAGFKVKCDTSIILGHVMTTREVITPENRVRVMSETNQALSQGDEFDPKWVSGTAYNMFYLDAMEYLEMDPDGGFNELVEMFDTYNDLASSEFPVNGTPEDLKEYYRTRGGHQLARQVFYHGMDGVRENDAMIIGMFNGQHGLKGLDFACGASPIGFELVNRGHSMDFIDIDGGGSYEFVKWRANRRDVEDRCGWELGEDYDFILLMDALEHFPDPVAILDDLIPRLKEGGVIITNFFVLEDDENIEHISMDKDLIKKTLVGSGVYPLNPAVWMKRDLDTSKEEQQ